MAQPLPFGKEESEGWWAKTEPFITLPFVVGSVCGHTLSGATVPGSANSIPAADNTHCSECTAVEVTRPEQPPIAGIPTVVGIVCRHALGGINTPIGPTTIPAAVTRLCATCASFNKIAQELSTRYKTVARLRESLQLDVFRSCLGSQDSRLQAPTGGRHCHQSKVQRLPQWT